MYPLLHPLKTKLASLIPVATWRYRLPTNLSVGFDNPGIQNFCSDYFNLVGDRMFVREGYAWNGCNPAYAFQPWWAKQATWLGTPDGPLNGPWGLPQSWKASLLHDCLCQYRDQMRGVSKAFTVELFHRTLLESGFEPWRAKLYAQAVNHFGPQDWK